MLFLIIIFQQDFQQMADKSVLLSVHKQKIKQTETHLLEWMSVKDSFLKKHIPVQQRLIKNLDASAEVTMLRLREAASFLKEQKQLQTIICQRLQKGFLNDQKRFSDNISIHSSTSKVSSSTKKQQTSKQQPIIVWSSNIDKVFNCLSNSNKKRISDCKEYLKVIQKCQQDFSKQELRYQSEIKKNIKIIQKCLQKIDTHEKEQEALITNIKKDSKNKDRDGSFYLTEYKKIEAGFKNQFLSIAQRAKQVFSLMKTVLDNQKITSKRLKQIFEYYFKSKNIIYKENQFDQRFLGALMVIEDNVIDSRKQFFNKFLLNEDQIQQVKSLVVEPNLNGTTPNLQCIVRYLKLGYEEYLNKLNAKNKLEFFSNNLSYKRWNKVSLAQGWLITSYVPVTIYLTYDNLLGIFNQEGQFVHKISLKQARISKIGEGNVIFLQQVSKGFFSNNKEEYQIKFQAEDSLQEFMVFIQNKPQ